LEVPSVVHSSAAPSSVAKTFRNLDFSSQVLRYSVQSL
jgi:hypothetical protein